METHPVPQNITSYEFHLVGDMTLKQFLQLAGGIVIAFIIFRTPLVGFIKYPLAFISAVTGALMAFIPINGRPFSNWFFAFLKAIYSPTEFVWKPGPPPAVIAAPAPSVTPPQAPVKETPAAPDAAVSVTQKASNPQFVPSFSSLITSKLSHVAPASPTQTTSAVVTQAPPKPVPPSQPAKPVSTPPATAPVKEVPVQSVSSPGVTAPPPPAPSRPAPAQTVAAAPPAPISGSIQKAPLANITSLISAPTVPNVLTGIVIDSAGQPLNGITVEIIDTSTGIPSRALRTNRLGQFQIAIPLTPGFYNVIAEKDNLTFDPVSVQVKGDIVAPIVISAKT